MSSRLRVHPETPQRRFIERAGRVLREHGVVILPTDGSYALTAAPGSRQALEKIARIKRINSDRKLFSLIVPDLSDLSRYAVVTNHAYRILRRFLPGPYTFVLPASREVPRILLTKRKTIGLRVPEHPVPREVAREAGGALLATTLRLPGEEFALADPDEIERRVGRRVDLFLDCGWGGAESSTLIDLTEDVPDLLREGAGDPAPFR
ncbi:MAG: threonylcarbamoyl-AMP synthase [Acidobacteriota bacterium]|nr:MAG: threonylcarbamoyl-AMP synthase [Acidobacteriota bacterium]